MNYDFKDEDYNFKDEDCTLIKDGKISFHLRYGITDLINRRKYFIERTKSYSGVQKSKLLNEILLMVEEHEKMIDNYLKKLSKQNEIIMQNEKIERK